MTRWLIELEADERPGLPPVAVRIRRVLKLMLRGFELKAVDIRQQSTPGRNANASEATSNTSGPIPERTRQRATGGEVDVSQ